ncbi:uncharacterized protein LOC115213491 [Argonauta hians]
MSATMRIATILVVFCAISQYSVGEDVTSLCEMVAIRTRTFFVRSPKKCDEFYSCRGDTSSSVLMHCGKGTVFSQSLQVCVYRGSIFDDCERAFYGGKVDDPLCNNSTGLINDPHDCGRFIPCYDGTSYPSMRCQDKLHFSLEHQRCMVADKTICEPYAS